MNSEYKKAVDAYNALAKKALSGDAQARADKAKAMNEIRSIERDAARSGVVLRRDGTRIETHAKRSLQEEYVRRFDAKTPVRIVGRGGKEEVTTLAKHHSRRLLGK